MPNRYPQMQEIQDEATTEPLSVTGAGEDLLTVTEAARRLRIGRTTLYPYLMSGELESVRIGTRRFVPADAIAEFVAELRKPGQPKMDFDQSEAA